MFLSEVSRIVPNTCQTGEASRILIDVYVPISVETVSPDVLNRSGWKPVSRDMVTRWFDDRSRHGLVVADVITVT